MSKFNQLITPGQIVLDADNTLDNAPDISLTPDSAAETPEGGDNFLEKFLDNAGDEVREEDTPSPEGVGSDDIFKEEMIEELDDENRLDSVDFEDYLPSVAQHLHKKGWIKDLPQGVDPDNLTLDSYESIIEHNMHIAKAEAFQTGAEEMQKNILETLNPFSHKVLKYNLDNPNATADEVKALANEIAESEFLKSLTPEENSIEIVREYYKSAGWTNNEINNKLDGLVKSNSAEAEARILKPKLDKQAESIASKRIQEQELVKNYELNRLAHLEDRVAKKLETGTLNGVELTREDAGYLYAAILNEDTPVSLGSRTVRMGYAEAVLRHQKYEGNLDNVMLSLLVLKNGMEGINKYYSQQVKNKEVSKAVNEIKFGRKRKTATRENPRFNDLEALKFKFNNK